MATRSNDASSALGLLVLRLGASVTLFMAHGWGKVTHFAERAATFPDPLHVGSPISFTLVVFAEVVCTTLVALGLATRLAVVPLLIFFSVAFFIQHGADPFADKELALVLGLMFASIGLMGPGKYSLDALRGAAR